MIAFIATTSELLFGMGESLSDGVFKALFNGGMTGPPTLGEVTLEAAVTHYLEWEGSVEGYRDGVLSLVSIGDPALRLRIETR